MLLSSEFDLCISDNKTDAERYDITSAYDSSTDHEEKDQNSRRSRKQKKFPDHLTGRKNWVKLKGGTSDWGKQIHVNLLCQHN